MIDLPIRPGGLYKIYDEKIYDESDRLTYRLMMINIEDGLASRKVKLEFEMAFDVSLDGNIIEHDPNRRLNITTTTKEVERGNT